MNDLTKVGLATGVAVLLVLGMIFKNEPGSHQSGLRKAIQERERIVASLRMELQQADARSDALDLQLKASEDKSKQLSSQLNIVSAELDAPQLGQQHEQQPDTSANSATTANNGLHTRIATLELEVQGLREKLATSESSSQEIITSLNTQIRARSTLVAAGKSAQSPQQMQQVKADVVSEQGESDQGESAIREQLSSLAAERDELGARLTAKTSRLAERDQALSRALEKVDGLQRELTSVSAELDSISVERDEPAGRNATSKLITALNNQFAVAGINGIEVYQRSGGIVSVRAGNNEIFSPGSTAISAVGRKVLGEVGNVMAAMPDSRLQIEGHTDNIPIGPVMKGLYASNWDLSVARAMAAIRHLERRVGLGADRLSGAGFGEFMPVATNETAEGRSLNRRIEIVVYPLAQKSN